MARWRLHERKSISSWTVINARLARASEADLHPGEIDNGTSLEQRLQPKKCWKSVVVDCRCSIQSHQGTVISRLQGDWKFAIMGACLDTSADSRDIQWTFPASLLGLAPSTPTEDGSPPSPRCPCQIVPRPDVEQKSLPSIRQLSAADEGPRALA